MRTVDPDVFVQINDVLCRFFLSFDQRDWPTMAECLAPQVTIDYSSSGREPPSTMSGDDFVRRRQNAVDSLSKQHGFSNLLITPQPDEKVVSARCNYLIMRFALSREFSTAEKDFFHSCGSYQFLLGKIESEWKISSIKQNTLHSWGNAALHGGSSR
ncbi:nuclear transport factor 2 family protein [Halomonas cupida]|uniref:SnoaL-like domain-containing protein n=1 Tax=Halomonas cupida TaxID=44933 RepID=A0A1M7H9K9_9GAMM|nr:nuclear transport factor 2 family protein [Halomonas cupida]SHM25033.1 SnoaL-like domain-containing protein [Halomonas cupida]